jgi:hypothetical protein
MPEGPAGAPRLTTIGPLSRPTADDIRETWNECPDNFENQQEICTEVKRASVQVLKNQGIYADFQSINELNTGACHTIAKTVKNRIPYVEWRMTIGGDHSWVKYNGRHYDAQIPFGVEDLDKIPLFSDIQIILEYSKRYVENNNTPYDKPQTVEEMIISPRDVFRENITDQNEL